MPFCGETKYFWYESMTIPEVMEPTTNPTARAENKKEIVAKVTSTCSIRVGSMGPGAEVNSPKAKKPQQYIRKITNCRLVRASGCEGSNRGATKEVVVPPAAS